VAPGPDDMNSLRVPGGPGVDTGSGDKMDHDPERDKDADEGDDSDDDDLSTTWDETNLRRFDDGTTLTGQCGSSRVGGTKGRGGGRRDTVGT
jgi:hypothetical protein